MRRRYLDMSGLCMPEAQYKMIARAFVRDQRLAGLPRTIALAMGFDKPALFYPQGFAWYMPGGLNCAHLGWLAMHFYCHHS